MNIFLFYNEQYLYLGAFKIHYFKRIKRFKGLLYRPLTNLAALEGDPQLRLVKSTGRASHAEHWWSLPRHSKSRVQSWMPTELDA